MENEPMGRVIVPAKIEDLNDLENREGGLIPVEAVRYVEVDDALVDTGATSLLLPRRLIARLALRHLRTRDARGIGGTFRCRGIAPSA